MSDLLQQAMIDAAALKEAAMKNAENALIEKYSHEFNQTVQKLLEQEEAAPQALQLNSAPPPTANSQTAEMSADSNQQSPDLSAALVDPMAGDLENMDLTGDKKDAFSKVPGSFSDEEDEMITINFDQLRATLNEMLDIKHEAYDMSSKDVADDALHSEPKKGNNPVKVTVKGSKNELEEKWHEEELEEMTASDTQNEAEGGELEEMELMDEEPQQPQQASAPVAKTPAANPQQVATASAATASDPELEQALKAAKIDPKNPNFTRIKAGLTNILQSLKRNSDLIAAGGVGTVLLAAAQQLASKLHEQELEEQDGSADIVRGQQMKADGERQIARGTATNAAAQKELAGTSTMTPKTMEEEIELTEEELQELAEELRVDLKVGNLSDGYMGSTETQKREQRNVELAAARDSKATEEREAELEKMKDLMQENKKLKALSNDSVKTLSALKEQLEKMNLINAKLLYTNKALGNVSLNERQKNQIVESISKADSVLAAKTIYETVQNAVENVTKEKEAPQSLRETLNRAPTPYVVKKSANNSINDLMADRMKALAGIKKNK